MNPSTILRRSPDVLQTDVNDQPVLLHSTRWQYLHFDGAGGMIWKLLEQPMSLGMLISQLRQRYAVDEETCRRESESLLQKLLDEKFLIAEE
jgi:hypothetical protein